MIARVIIDSLGAVGDQFYDYTVPEKLKSETLPGKRVLVYFGRGMRLVPALVMELTDKSEYDESKLKEISEVVDDEVIVQPYLIETIRYMRDNYFCTYVDALHCILPSMEQLKRKETYAPLAEAEDLSGMSEKLMELVVKRRGQASDEYLMKKTGLERDAFRREMNRLVERGLVKKDVTYRAREERTREFVRLYDAEKPVEEYLSMTRKTARKQQDVIKALEEGPVEYEELRKRTGADRSLINRLMDMDIVSTFRVAEEDELQYELLEEKEEIKLNDEQLSVLEKYDSETETNRFLLHGVTGSGKTEVYKRMFRREIEKGRQALFLVPEIALTPQMMRNIYREFDGRVAIMHSRLTPSRRIREWEKVRTGKADVVLGARSALFMPFKNLGLIVIDEEHESSYKSSMTPRYDTVQLAGFMTDILGSRLVLGSATPNVESYYRVQTGSYRLLEMKRRTNGKQSPPVQVVDMTKELKSGNRTPISRLLYREMKDRLEKKEQIILFMNRRGFSTYVFCRKCGYVEECPNCDVSLTYHANTGTLRCHYCGHERRVRKICPNCGSDKIKNAGTGTQKIEAYVRKMFPDASVLRLDRDTVRNVDSMERILTDFRKQKADILIGTQMVVKGHDFPNVTLVGILLADASLNFPDINSPQRTFQLCTQASGRAGRAEKQGAVVMQTYSPKNRTIVYSAVQDYMKFYTYDIEYRMNMNYPPFTELLGLFVVNADEMKADSHARILHERLLKLLEEKERDDVTLYPPMDAFAHKRNNRYTVHVLVRYNVDDEIKREIRKIFADFRRDVDSDVFAETNPVTLL